MDWRPLSPQLQAWVLAMQAGQPAAARRPLPRRRNRRTYPVPEAVRRLQRHLRPAAADARAVPDLPAAGASALAARVAEALAGTGHALTGRRGGALSALFP